MSGGGISSCSCDIDFLGDFYFDDVSLLHSGVRMDFVRSVQCGEGRTWTVSLTTFKLDHFQFVPVPSELLYGIIHDAEILMRCAHSTLAWLDRVSTSIAQC